MRVAANFPETIELRRRSAPLRGWVVLRTLVAVLLFFAAEMKARQLSEVPPPVKSGASGRSLVSSSVPVFSAFFSRDAGNSVLLGTEYTRGDGRRTILLEPDKWPGGEFPLLPYIEPAEVRSLLRSGTWTVVIYRGGCPKCREVKDFLAKKNEPHVVFLEILPREGEEVLPSGFVHANLSERFAWSVDTPMIFQVGEKSFKQLSIQTLLQGETE